MSIVSGNQPLGTPTWIDIGIPDLDRGMAFYGALFGWEFDVGGPEIGGYTMCLVRGRPVAAMVRAMDSGAEGFWWSVHLATDDCDATVDRVLRAGGSVVAPAMDVMDKGRMAIVKDSVGGQFGLWQGRAHVGCELVNEPNTLVRNDLSTSEPERARAFYASVFDFTLDRNEDLPDLDFTFLRRPDGHEIGGVLGDPKAIRAMWSTTFEVDNTDSAVSRALEAGGTSSEPTDTPYGRFAVITDPFGAEFSVIARS